MYRLFLAFQYLRSRPIHLIGMVGVMLAVWALIVVVSIFSGFIREVRTHIRSASSDLSVLNLPWPTEASRVLPFVEADPDVAAASPRLIWYGLLHAYGKEAEVAPSVSTMPGAGDDRRLVVLIGIDAARERQVSGFGEWLATVEDPRLAVPDPGDPFAAREPRGGGEPLPVLLLSQRRIDHEYATLPGTEPTPVLGQRARVHSAKLERDRGRRALALDAHDFVLGGAYATRHKEFDDSNAFCDIATLQRMLAGHGEAGTADAVTEIAIRLRPGADPTAVSMRLERGLAELLDAPGVFVASWEVLNAPLLGAVDHQRGLMKLVLAVIMIVAGFLIYATLSMMVGEKVRDIGILTAMGGTSRGVSTVFLMAGLNITLVGTLLGVLSGCLSARHLEDFRVLVRDWTGVDLFPVDVYNLDRVPYELDPTWILQVVALAFVTGILVSVLPAWWVARQDPLRSIRAQA